VRLTLHRRPANPRTLADTPCPPSYFDPLTGREYHRELTFDDIRAQPDPEWARPTAARQQAWAQARADAAFADVGPYGPVIIAARRVSQVVSQADRVLDEIEAAATSLRELWAQMRQGVV